MLLHKIETIACRATSHQHYPALAQQVGLIRYQKFAQAKAKIAQHEEAVVQKHVAVLLPVGSVSEKFEGNGVYEHRLSSYDAWQPTDNTCFLPANLNWRKQRYEVFTTRKAEKAKILQYGKQNDQSENTHSTKND